MLFTDVVMPGTLKSPELARKAKERLPNIAVLFTSGYTENSIVHGGRLDVGVELLSKPYTLKRWRARSGMFWRIRPNVRHKVQSLPARTLSNLDASNLDAPLTSPARSEQPRETHDRRITVLLVEDEALIRLNTAEIMEDAGVIVVEAGSAEEAKAALQTMAIDVLVTDVNLPGASGSELAAEARALRPATLIVYATVTRPRCAVKRMPLS